MFPGLRRQKILGAPVRRLRYGASASTNPTCRPRISRAGISVLRWRPKTEGEDRKKTEGIRLRILISGFFLVCRTERAARRARGPRARHGLSEHLFKFGVFSLQFFQMPSFVDVHLAKLPLPTVISHLGDVFLLANLHDAFAAIGTPQDADLISVVERFPFIVWFLLWAPD